jgi:hypothetical protein
MPGSFGPLAESRPGMKITICRPGRGFRKLDLSRIPPLARWAKFWRPRCGLAIGCCRTGAFHKELSGRCTRERLVGIGVAQAFLPVSPCFCFRGLRTQEWLCC